MDGWMDGGMEGGRDGWGTMITSTQTFDAFLRSTQGTYAGCPRSVPIMGVVWGQKVAVIFLFFAYFTISLFSV